jgi:hypothetical protein
VRRAAVAVTGAQLPQEVLAAAAAAPHRSPSRPAASQDSARLGACAVLTVCACARGGWVVWCRVPGLALVRVCA